MGYILPTPANDQPSKDFAIFGGGSIGPVLLIYIAQEAQEAGASLVGKKFHGFDPEGFCNGGKAYKECSPNHLLNSTRDEMSPWAPSAFHDWRVSEGGVNDIKTFEKRRVNAPFLNNELQQAIKTLKSLGAQFIEHKTTATPVLQDDGTFTVVNSSGDVVLTDLSNNDFVATVGYGPNENFSNLIDYEDAGYIHSPYDLTRISQITTGQRVAFVGAGPALYDVANDFNTQATNPNLLIFSREGRFLQVRDVSREANEISVPPDFLNSFDPESAEKLKEKIQSEFHGASLNGNRTDRRVALDIMAGLGKHLERMDTDVVQEFCRSAYFGRLKGMATPVPAESDAVLRALNPQTVRGRLNRNIKKLRSGFLIDEQHEVDTIINGTGHGRINSPFIKLLIDQGLASINPHLGILNTDDTGYRLTDSGIAVICPAIHFGIDGIESFAKYCEPFAKEYVTGILEQRSAQRPQRVLTATG